MWCQNFPVSTVPPEAVSFAYLTTPPEVCGEGPTAARPQLLRLSSLGSKDFERLCYRMTRLRGEVEHCRLYGVHGQAQKGIDLYALQHDGSYLVVQCKRSSDQFTPGEITEAVDTFLAGDWVGKTKEFVLAVTANLERTQAADRIEEERLKLTRRGITFTVWDQTEISALLKDHPRLVDDFFGRAAVRTFLGDAVANAFGDHLDAADMIAYRSSGGPSTGVHRLIALPVPYLTDKFVERSAIEGCALALLLGQPSTTRGRIVGLTGMSGVGKTLLAQAIAFNARIIDRFPDGVLWLDLHRDPSVMSCQAEILRAFGENVPDGSRDLKALLRQRLAEARCLIVLDNVTRFEQIDAIDSVGPGSALLVTTHDQGLLPDGAGICLVEPFDMTGPAGCTDSRELLERYSGESLPTPSPNVDKVLLRCDGLPFALAICGSMIHDRHTWAEVAVMLETSALGHLEKWFRGYPNPSLLAALEVSMKLLPGSERELYDALAVFSGCGPIPTTAAHRLWSHYGLDTLQTRRMIVRLDRRSLLTYQPEDGTFHLHDLLSRYVVSHVGDALPQLHHRLAEAYLQAWGGLSTGLPNVGEDDEYGVTHMTFHLEKAGRDDLLHQLLAVETPASAGEPANRWFTVHDQAGRTAHYLADIARAWQRAQQATDRCTIPDERAYNRALEMRYALAKSSLTSIATSVPTPLMIALIQQNIWSFAKAWAYSDTIPDPLAKARALGALARLPDTFGIDRDLLLKQARVAAAAVEQAQDQAWALAALIPCVPRLDRLSLFEAAMKAADEAPQEKTRAWILARLAPHLQEQIGDRFLAVLRTRIDRRSDLAQAVALAAPHLPELRSELQAQVLRVRNPHARMIALVRMLACAPEPEQAGLLAQAHAALYDLEKRRTDRTDGWVAAAAKLTSSDNLHALLETLLGPMRHLDTKAQALAALMPHLPEVDQQAVLDAAVATVRDAGPKVHRDTLAAVVPHVPDTERAQLIDEVITAHRGNLWTMCVLAPYLPERLLSEAVDTACALTIESRRTGAFEELAPHLPPGLLRRALNTVLNLDTPKDRGLALARLASRLPAEQCAHALAVVTTIEDPNTRLQLLAELALYLPHASVQAALDSVPAQGDHVWRTVVLMQLAMRATGSQRATIHAQALDTACQVELRHNELQCLTRNASDPWELSYLLRLQCMLDGHPIAEDLSTLADLASFLPAGTLDQATEIVRAMTDQCARSCALAALVPCASEASRATLLKEALDAACLVHNHPDKIYCQIEKRLAEAVRHVPEAERLRLPDIYLDDAITSAEEADPGMWDDDWRIRQLICLATYLPVSYRPVVLDAAIRQVPAIHPDRYQVRTLCALAPFLLPTHCLKAIELIEALQEPGDRVATFIALAHHAPPPAQASILAQAVATFRSSINQTAHWSLESLTHLSPYLPDQERAELFGRALDLISEDANDESRARAIATLAPHLPAHLFDRASHIAEDIFTPRERATASRALELARNPSRPDHWRFWRNTIADAAAAGRPTLLALTVDACLAVGDKTPLAEPEPTAVYLAQSIVATQRWWPGGSHSPRTSIQQACDKFAEIIDADESKRESWMSG